MMMVIIWLMMVKNLLGGAIAILKHMSSSMGRIIMDDIPYIMENNMFQTTKRLNNLFVGHKRRSTIGFWGYKQIPTSCLFEGAPTYGDGSKPYLVNPKIAGKWMFIPLKMYL